MHSSAFFTFFTFLFLASLSAARIVGISAPASVFPGKKFNVVFQTENYIQNWSDESVILGIRKGDLKTCDTCLGAPLAYLDLHAQGHYNTGHGNFTESISIKEPGSYVIAAAVTSIFGASEEVAVHFQTTAIHVR
ncbi:hypothetical protein FRB93_010400 [Tulasnella sp. JGI-2019a]|nr:hypothetical protein FRB93_010400 [Tulasnella sp. JGI-2019a]